MDFLSCNMWLCIFKILLKCPSLTSVLRPLVSSELNYTRSCYSTTMWSRWFVHSLTAEGFKKPLFIFQTFLKSLLLIKYSNFTLLRIIYIRMIWNLLWERKNTQEDTSSYLGVSSERLGATVTDNFFPVTNIYNLGLIEFLVHTLKGDK